MDEVKRKKMKNKMADMTKKLAEKYKEKKPLTLADVRKDLAARWAKGKERRQSAISKMKKVAPVEK